MNQVAKPGKDNIFVKFWRLIALRNSFRIGLITFLPIAAVLFLGSFILETVNEKGIALLKNFLPPAYLFPYSGILFLTLAIYIFGRWLTREERTEKYFLYRWLQKIPVFGKFIRPRGKEKSFQPCLFWQTPTVLTLGIISGIQKIDGVSDPKVIITLIDPPPASIMLVNKNLVVKLSIGFEQALQLSASFGMSHPELLKPIPWENETPEECLKRIKECPPLIKG